MAGKPPTGGPYEVPWRNETLNASSLYMSAERVSLNHNSGSDGAHDDSDALT